MADPALTVTEHRGDPTRGKAEPAITALGVAIVASYVVALVAFAYVWRRAGQDVDVLLVAFLSGCLGAFVHQATSFSTFVGNRRMSLSWSWWYVMRIPVGGALSLLGYLAYAAGLLGEVPREVPVAKVAAIGALAGLFSRQFVDKLNDVLDGLFPSRANAERKDKTKPVRKDAVAIAEIRPREIAPGAASLVVAGSGFSKESIVFVNGRAAVPTKATESELTLALDAADTNDKEAVRIQVRNPDGTQSTPTLVPVVKKAA